MTADRSRTLSTIPVCDRWNPLNFYNLSSWLQHTGLFRITRCDVVNYRVFANHLYDKLCYCWSQRWTRRPGPGKGKIWYNLLSWCGTEDESTLDQLFSVARSLCYALHVRRSALLETLNRRTYIVYIVLITSSYVLWTFNATNCKYDYGES